MNPNPNEGSGSGDRFPAAAMRGRARGRARGEMRTEEGTAAEGGITLGRRLEPRIGDLSLQEVETTPEQERRYAGDERSGRSGDGRRPINLDRYDFVRTRENNDVVKCGGMGSPRDYITNFFRVNTGPAWYACLITYTFSNFIKLNLSYWFN